MEKAIEDAIKALARLSQNAATSLEAMQYAQAALNLAHTASTIASKNKYLS